jgi:L-alanine-DL-glutamate epimerase-like enolase superfamily enzyme
MRRLIVRRESWPIRGTFVISRGAKSVAEVVLAELREERRRGRGECVPYPRYGESPGQVMAQIEGLRHELEHGLSLPELQQALPPGAARNALDCALWDLEAKRAGRRVWEIAGLPAPGPLVTAFTLSLDAPEAMAKAARAQRLRPLLKLKLGGAGDLERVRAVRQAAPRSRLIVDANEAWTPETLVELMPEMAALGVALIEQPLPAGADQALAEIERPVPVCADESCHDRSSVAELGAKYDYLNIKLDKCGGLTEALALARAGQEMGFGLMVGCMVGTSLAMAPAMVLGAAAEFVDLDGPLLLARDRRPGLRFEGSTVEPPPAALWG